MCTVVCPNTSGRSCPGDKTAVLAVDACSYAQSSNTVSECLDMLSIQMYLHFNCVSTPLCLPGPCFLWYRRSNVGRCSQLVPAGVTRQSTIMVLSLPLHWLENLQTQKDTVHVQATPSQLALVTAMTASRDAILPLPPYIAAELAEGLAYRALPSPKGSVLTAVTNTVSDLNTRFDQVTVKAGRLTGLLVLVKYC